MTIEATPFSGEILMTGVDGCADPSRYEVEDDVFGADVGFTTEEPCGNGSRNKGSTQDSKVGNLCLKSILSELLNILTITECKTLQLECKRALPNRKRVKWSNKLGLAYLRIWCDFGREENQWGYCLYTTSRLLPSYLERRVQ